MTVSPLANMKRDIPALDRWQPRNSRISGFGIHHNAGVNAYGQATAAGREVSANYWITNEGDILPNVNEEYRAFTSGSAGYPAGAAADHRNITVEVSNSPEGVRKGTWAISDAAMEALARLIGDVYRRYKLGPVKRGGSKGIGVHRDWVPTECPGPYMMSHLPALIKRAEWHRTHPDGAKPAAKPATKPKPKPALNEEDEMEPAYLRDPKDKNGTIYMINSAGKKRSLRKAEWDNRKDQRRSMGMQIPPVADVSTDELAKYPNA